MDDIHFWSAHQELSIAVEKKILSVLVQKLIFFAVGQLSNVTI